MRWLKWVLLSIVGVLIVVALGGYLTLRGSLPQLDGALVYSTLTAKTTIERDSLGVVTISGANRNDVAFATGYAHGQDRFFQMDLQRRAAAGELSALLGPSLLSVDKRFRRHNFRSVARRVVANATAEQRALMDAYVRGVNAALASQRVRSFEYLLLGQRPKEWLVEDCLLVAYTMYIDLNDSDGTRELERARLHATLPQALFDLLYPRGTEWDATLDDVDLSDLPAPIPGPNAVDFSKKRSGSGERAASEADHPGSNNWAVAGTRTANGAALLANDMHLSFRLPHIWYRARLIVKSADPKAARDLMGVTLPGLPLLVAGSNTHIAWGFTNTHGNFDDLVLVATDESRPNQYRDREVFRDFVLRRERIEVNGGTSIEVEYRDTKWGPLLDEKLDGYLVALAWTAQEPDATNLSQLELEGAVFAHDAVAIANTIGIPVQNFVVADAQGHIGWTPIGKLPKRAGFDGKLPACWGCAPNIGWNGWIAPEEYPRIVDPPKGQLWSANSRTLGGPHAELIGDEDMDRGARTRQIRDDLLALSKATPADMLKIQLDGRALFLKRWRDLLVRMQDEAYFKGHEARRYALKLVEQWTGTAGVDDAGYRIVRTFRLALQDDIYRQLIGAAQAKYPDAKFRPSARFEDTLWRIATSQPEHFLGAEFERWDLRILASLDRAIEQLEGECDTGAKKLQNCTWGKRNTLNMEHPLAPSLPLVGRLLRMPHDEIPGDNDMPRVQGVSFGASERFAVSPGHESEGYFHMPGGQSGHPLSHYFSAGHEAWVKGEPLPFMPGATEHRLELSARP